MNGMGNRRNKILIIVIRYIPFKEKSYYEFPLGLAYISASLKQAGYAVEVLNLNHHDGTQSDLLKERLANGDIGYVMTGGLSAHYRAIQRIIDDVRAIDEGVRVIIGGGVISASPELMFHTLRPDYMVIGEGEITVVELLDALTGGADDIHRVKGIGYSDSAGRLIITPAREPIMDLDSIPFPDLEGFEFERYLDMQRPNDSLYLYIDDKPRFYPIISSRGCPYNCTFCYHPSGSKYRSRSIDNFMAEVKFVTERYGVNNLAIFDELISADRERLVEICRRLKELPKQVHWICQLRVDEVDQELLFMLKDAGCFLISYGFESACNEVLKSMRKHITVEQIESAMEMTRQAGIGIQGYFIFGDPAETMESARKTLEFWKKHHDYHLTLGYIRPFPGSVLWKKQVENKSLEEQLHFLNQCIENPPNMSKMDTYQWQELRKEVYKALLSNEHFGTVLSSERIGERGYRIRIQCPHCNQEVTYGNFHQRILGVFKLNCRHCNQAMNIKPLAFTHVQEDYRRNKQVFNKLATGVPVTVTPCMDEGEFAAQAELLLEGIEVAHYLDISESKVGMAYMGKKIEKRDAETINRLQDNYFLIPLTRFADRVFAHLVSLGVEPERICRLDEIHPRPV
ncbi:radical SAM protein [Heliobacillus mobilis]|uniref:Radical SAM protein n=1 Tax=Heliobacterium mobile TaxID=28064 RepID=A0A6I3SLA3_HELMO|nr:radical SAM protein [Heliobacterium mobile]MTV49683.1 radical SAM protein [Heliobacterium mobile]